MSDLSCAQSGELPAVKRERSKPDELAIMKSIARLLDQLPDEHTRIRVVSWVSDKVCQPGKSYEQTNPLA